MIAHFHTPCFVLDSNLIRLALRATFPKGEGLLTDYQLPHLSRFASHLPQMGRSFDGLSVTSSVSLREPPSPKGKV